MDAQDRIDPNGCPMGKDGGVRGAARAAPTATGGRTRWRSTSCTSNGASATRWATTSTMPRRSSRSTTTALKGDLTALMTDSQPWWPADYGHYGPFFIRMAWHAAGTYRTGDGRGGANSGQQRFAPLNSWPDNGNLDKARRLLWPIKQKYGKHICPGPTCSSWPAMSRSNRWAGRCSASAAAAPTCSSPRRTSTGATRTSGSTKACRPASSPTRIERLDGPLAAIQMGLIYVNPEGPGGNPDALQSARDIKRDLRAHGDERRGDGRPDGGRPHLRQGARQRRRLAGRRRRPRAATSPSRASAGSAGHESGGSASTPSPAGSRAPGSTRRPSGAMNYFRLLLDYDYELVRSPAGAKQWQPVNQKPEDMAPAAHDPSKRVPTMMTTADMALKIDPEYRAIIGEVPQRPRGVRRRLRPRLVQAVPPRHGAQGPLPRAGSAGRGPDLAGPDPGRNDAARDADIARAQGADRGSGLTRQPSWSRRPGPRPRPIASPTIAAAPTARASASRPQKDWDVNEPADAGQGARAKLDGLRGQRSRSPT